VSWKFVITSRKDIEGKLLLIRRLLATPCGLTVKEAWRCMKYREV